jgi:AbiV family abortive infection protein
MDGSQLSMRIEPNLLETYRACLNNASDLLGEATLLVERGSFPRAYALAFTALEEISKSQLAADLFTGFIPREEFDAAFRDHKRKIKRTQWAVLFSHGDIEELPEDAIIPIASKRMAALYVDVDDRLAPMTPRDRVSEREARELIKIVKSGIKKIRQWEAMGVQIGTKGFMK